MAIERSGSNSFMNGISLIGVEALSPYLTTTLNPLSLVGRQTPAGFSARADIPLQLGQLRAPIEKCTII